MTTNKIVLKAVTVMSNIFKGNLHIFIKYSLKCFMCTYLKVCNKKNGLPNELFFFINLQRSASTLPGAAILKCRAMQVGY